MEGEKNQSDKKKEQTLSKGQIVAKKKKGKELVTDLVINFKFDDFEPVSNKYQPSYKKQHGKIYYDDVDILDQSRFKFVLNLNEEAAGSLVLKNKENKLILNNKSSANNHYMKYSHGLNSNLLWEDILALTYFSSDINNCPICLEKKLVCPTITRCGHIFCWPCVISYYDYWTTEASICSHKKIPQCPLCKERINLSQLKFCDIYQCVNYVSHLDVSLNEKEKEDKYNTHFITFNLIMKNKKAPTLYNTFYDPDLGYYKQHLNEKDAFCFVPLENQEEFSFSRIFSTNPKLILKRYYKIKSELEEALKDELSLYADERKINSINTCMDIIMNKIKLIRNKKNINDEEDFEQMDDFNNENLSENRNNQNQENDKIVIESSINSFSPKLNNRLGANLSNSENVNENLSTIDEDVNKSDINIKDFLYFYQEQFGDIYFLHPINYSILITEYGSEETLPTEVTGKILEIEMHQITPFIKNKYPFLNHLKIGSMFFLVEIDMKQLVSNHTLKQFHNVLKERAKVRNSIKREEEHYDNYVQNLKTKEERKISTDLIINSKQFKIKDCFKFIEEDDHNHSNDRKESNENLNTEEKIESNDKKENKLKLLLENNIQIKPEAAKKNNGAKFYFTSEDFPEIKQTPKIMKEINSNYETDYTHLDNNINLYENIHLDEGFTIVKQKYRGEKKNSNKNKKFAEINFDLIKEIEGKQFEQTEPEGERSSENNLKKNLASTTEKNKKKTTTILVNKKITGNSKKK